jgi:hypothetical protein
VVAAVESHHRLHAPALPASPPNQSSIACPWDV